MREVNKKIAKGSIWMILFKLMERSLGLVSTIILARLLIPEDFGLIAMAMSIVAVLELLSAFNFDIALIQNQNVQRKHLDTAWTLNVLFGAASGIILAFLANATAIFYQETRLELIIYLLALGRVIQGFQNIGIVAFRKEMEFHKEFKFLLSKKLVGFSITLPIAFITRSYWALITGMVLSTVFATTYSYFIHHYRPRFCLSARGELLNFSKWLLLNNILFFLKIRAADFIVGKFVGPKGLGLHSIAYEISNLPTTELVAPINRAVFPGYSKMAQDLTILRQGYLNVISMIALITLPTATGIAVTADLLVPVFLGNKWLDIVPLIQILAFFGAISALQTNIGSVYLAIGKPKILTLLALAYLVFFLPTLLVLTHRYGVIGTAWSFLAAAMLFLPLNYIVMFRTISLRALDFFRVIYRPIVATVIMYLSVSLLLNNIKVSHVFLEQFIVLMLISALGAVIYSIVVIGAWVFSGKPDGAEKFILDRIIPPLKSKLSLLYKG